MSTKDFYNSFASTYDRWISNDIQVNALTQVYVNYLNKVDKKATVVYLGIATGRIALELIDKTSLTMTGIDNSQEMIEVCKKNFKKHNMLNMLQLIEEDILNFKVYTKNNIFILPFRTMSHFLSKEDKKECLLSVYNNMKEGEIFIFDLDIHDEKKAQEYNNQTFLSYNNEQTGEVIYSKFDFNYTQQIVDVTVYTANLVNQKLENLCTHKYKSSWITPLEIQEVVLDVGFRVEEKLLESKHQVWVLTK